MFNKKGGVTNKGVSYPPQGDTAAVAVSKDWEARDFTQTIQLGVSQLTLFLNQFDATTRGRLSELNSKLAKLERRLELVESTLHTVDQGQ
mmetsp:Transcript_43473/g.98268  ORF Transcript_43473/g.98268 Transcript_43473/m.98268 type:complete len:90 (+) Transcript_43473:49-318(+)